MSGNQDLEVPIKASHARIEITPQWDEMGEDYKKDEDQVIKWYQVSKYASQMEIKVDKVQEWEEKNFYELVGDFLLQTKQKKVVEGNLF